MRRFTTFDKDLVEFLYDRGFIYINTFTGRNDIGYDYDYIPNLKAILNEYNSIKSELKEKKSDSNKQEIFEKILDSFLKTSKEKNKESEREHTKSDKTKKKKDKARRRKSSE